MKKTYKVLSMVMVVVMLLMAASPVILANGLIDPASVTPETTGGVNSGLTTIGQRVLGIITNIGIVISVLVIAGLGIKYITGSADEKAEYKKSFVPLLIGMVLLLGASAIAKFLISTASNFNP